MASAIRLPRARRALRGACGSGRTRARDPRARSPDPSLDTALAQAGALFTAGLYFEVHEILEPHWMRAEGEARETLQGLIQAAVGYQHLANGNLAGARALLHDGAAKLLGRKRPGADLDAFARGVADHARALTLPDARAAGFDWSCVPRFPARV